MRIQQLHDWDLEPGEAFSVQNRLSGSVVCRPFKGEPRFIAGVDAAYEESGPRIWAAAVVYDTVGGRVIEQAGCVSEVRFDYKPGLLAFREGPALLEALGKIEAVPDVVMFDGHGILHPRGLGLAAHLGLCLDVPTIGCAKDLLCGETAPVGTSHGDIAYIHIKGRPAGYVVRTRSHVKPVYVSPGHLMDSHSAARTVLLCCTGFRTPEPLRLAHQKANELRRNAMCDRRPG